MNMHETRDQENQYRASPDGQLDLAGAAIKARIDSYTRLNWGVRCEEYEPECCLCKVWKARDAFCEAITV